MQQMSFNEKFWTAFRKLPESKIPLHSKAKYNERNFLDLGYKNGIAYYYTISKQKKQWTVGLYINFADKSKTEKTFESLKIYENKIQTAFGSGELEWTKDRSDRCKILHTKKMDKLGDDENSWKQIQLEMIETLVRFEKSVAPFIAKLP